MRIYMLLATVTVMVWFVGIAAGRAGQDTRGLLFPDVGQDTTLGMIDRLALRIPLGVPVPMVEADRVKDRANELLDNVATLALAYDMASDESDRHAILRRLVVGLQLMRAHPNVAYAATLRRLMATDSKGDEAVLLKEKATEALLANPALTDSDVRDLLAAPDPVVQAAAIRGVAARLSGKELEAFLAKVRDETGPGISERVRAAIGHGQTKRDIELALAKAATPSDKLEILFGVFAYDTPVGGGKPYVRDTPVARYAHAQLKATLLAFGDGAKGVLDTYIQKHPNDAWMAEAAASVIFDETKVDTPSKRNGDDQGPDEKVDGDPLTE